MKQLFTILFFVPVFALSQNAPPTITGATSYSTSNGTVTLSHAATDDSGAVAKWRITKLKTPATVKRNNFAVTGSSTYIGAYATATVATNSTKDSSMMGQVKNFYKAYGRIDTIWNYARLSRQLYEVMHTGYANPGDRLAPNLDINIDTMIRRIERHYSTAGAAAPNGTGVMMLGFPSNGYDFYRPTEVDTLLKIINDTITARGYKWSYGSAQPRHAFAYAATLNHKAIHDTMMTAYPDKVMNYWEGFINEPRFTGVEASSYIMRSDWNSGDNVHFNYPGHVQIAKQTIAHNPLSVLLESEPGTITNGASPSTTITGLTAGTYYFVVASQDNDSLWNYMVDTVVSTWNGVTANAGADKTIALPTTTTSFTGSGTGGAPLVYSWSKVSGPAGGAIGSPSSSTTSITGLTKGVYVYRLTVFDNAEQSATDDVTVTVTGPTADAGTDREIALPRNSVHISSAVAERKITYQWTKVSGPAGDVIERPTKNMTAINNLTAGTFLYRLTVTDSVGATASDTVQITVHPYYTGGVQRQISFTGGKTYDAPRGNAFLSSTVLPGDTLMLPATDTADLIDLAGLHGTAARPITVMATKPIRYMRAGNDSGLTHVRFIGLNFLGFKSNGTPEGVVFSLSRVANVEVANCIIAGGGTGLMCKLIGRSDRSYTERGNWLIDNIYIHHNTLNDIGGEGMYIGHTRPDSDYAVPSIIPVRNNNVEIAYNTINTTHWDAIQLSNSRFNGAIHHNTITNYGTDNIAIQRAGIILGGNTSGDVYENTVTKGTGNGIQAFGYGIINIYNNTLDSVGYEGTANGVESIFTNDVTVTSDINPKQKLNIFDNVIKKPAPINAIRVGAYQNNSLPADITGNSICVMTVGALTITDFIEVTSGSPGIGGDVTTGNTLTACTIPAVLRRFLTVGGKYLVGPDGKKLVIIN